MKREQIERGMEMNRMIEISRKMKAMMIYLLSGLVYVWMMSCAPAASSSTPIDLSPFSATGDIKISGPGAENAEITVREGVGGESSAIVIEGLKNSIDTVEWVLAIAGREGAFQVIRGASISFATPGIGMYASITQVLSDELVIMDEKTGETMTYKIEVAFIGVAVKELITGESFRATFAGQDGTVELTGNVIKITNLNNQASGVTGALALSGPSSLPTGYGWTGDHAIMDPDGDVTNVTNFRLAGVMIYEETTDEGGLVVRLPRNTETFTVTVYLDEPLTPLVGTDITAVFAETPSSRITIVKRDITIYGFRNIGDAYVIDATDVVTVTDRMGVFTSTTVPDPLVIENPTEQSATDEVIGTIAVTPTGATEAVVYNVTVAFGAALGVRIPGNVVEGSPLGEPIVLTEGVSRTEVVKVRRCGYFNSGFVILEGGAVKGDYSAEVVDSGEMRISPYYDSATVANNTNAVEIRVANAQGVRVVTLNVGVEIQECQANENGFAEGEGTPAAPWIVDTDMRLDLMSKLVNMGPDSAGVTYADDAYMMTTDIDLGAAEMSGSWTESIGITGFIPIGYTVTATGRLISTRKANGFTGEFDCDGNTISNLYISNNRSSGETNGHYLGLFSFIKAAAVVRDCVLENAKVIGVSHIGAFAGWNSGRIERVSVMSGVVTVMSDVDEVSDSVGGLVGAHGGVQRNAAYEITGVEGTIANSSAMVDVTGRSGNNGDFGVGGLVGWSAGRIERSHATGSVEGFGNVGGLIGRAYGATIENSYHETGAVTGTTNVGGLIGQYVEDGMVTTSRAMGDVTGMVNVGGLIGENTSSIEDSHATGNVYGRLSVSDSIGGLIGSHLGTNDINDCSATGDVWGGEYVGGLIGYSSIFVGEENPMGGTITNSFATGPVIGVDKVGGLVGFNKTPIIDSYSTSHVSGVSIVGGLVGYSFSDITGSRAEGKIDGQVYVGGLVGRLRDAKIMNSHATGNVDASTNVGGLVGIAAGNVETSYATGEVKGFDSVGGLVGTHIGTIHQVGGAPDEVFPTYISNSYATGSVLGYRSVGGLAGNTVQKIMYSYATGSVNSEPDDYDVGEILGGLVGYSLSNIEGSFATGNVRGRYSLGGLVGINRGDIKHSYATGTVTTGIFNDYFAIAIGGLVGSNAGHVISSYATATVTGGSITNVGGLVGGMGATATITDSYAVGSVSVTAISMVGGLVGLEFPLPDASPSPFINSYWDTNTTGQVTSGTLTTGRTTAQMQVAAPVPSGAASVYVDWNKETVDPATTKAGTWEFSSGSYPKLLRVVCANRQYADPVPDCQ